MPHSRPVTRIMAKDNPKVKAPQYPGKYSRNYKQGVPQTKDEWLEEHTDLWLQHMVNKPSYRKSYTADKAVILLLHLSKSLRPGTKDYPKFRKLLLAAEYKLEQKNVGNRREGIMGGNDWEVDESREGDFEGDNESDGRENNREGGNRESADREQDSTEKGKQEAGNIRGEDIIREDSENNEIENCDSRPILKKNRTEKEFEVAKLLRKTDEELFGGEGSSKEERNNEIWQEMKGTEVFRKRESEYAGRYFHQHCENKTDAELLLSLSELPEAVQKSKLCTDRIQNLSKQDRSEIVAMKELRKTMDQLKINNTKESREQQKVLAASVTSLEFGVPNLSLHPRVEKEVLEMKRQLLEGKESILNSPEKEIKQMFPLDVKNIAVKYWEEITVTEPGKHRRFSKTVKDKDEMVLDTKP